jgi:glutamyl-Q tRNA(Asp) synthetase
MIVTRFAPSPTGHLHLGSVYSALFARRAARDAAHNTEGRFLVRIEDIDHTRCKPEFAERMLADLTWLGLTWHGEVRRQSEHMADYQAALARLDAMGLLYPCFCTRGQIAAEIQAAGGAPHGPDGPLYPGTCRALTRAEADARIAAGQLPAWRLHMVRAVTQTGPLTFHDRERGRIECHPTQSGDVVLARKDSPTSYHLSVTVDDALQGITLVTRGEDLLHATDIHRLLQALLDLPEPEYHHHRLLLGPDGKRFAKRDKSVSVPDLRAADRTAANVLAMAEKLASV